LDSYILGVFAHRLKRVLSREKIIEFVPTNKELAELRGAQDWNWVTNLENVLELKRTVSKMDDWMKEVYFRRSFGDSWELSRKTPELPSIKRKCGSLIASKRFENAWSRAERLRRSGVVGSGFLPPAWRA
jgi:hypothetical protein